MKGKGPSFSGLLGVTYSSEAKLLAIKEVLKIFKKYFQGRMLVEGDLVNTIWCVQGRKMPSLKLISILEEIRELSRNVDVSLSHVRRLTNGQME